MSLNRKILIFFIGAVVLGMAFLAYISWSAGNLTIIFASAIFIVLIVLLMAVYLLVIKNHMSTVLTQLSEVIASLIDQRETEIFSSINDDMLSKLQSQVTKLSGILKAQNKKLLDEKNEIKALITDIAHQLKNPLANLNIYSTLLLDKKTSGDQKLEFAQNINAQLEKLNWLMESMIKMSRLESGIIQLKQEPCDMNDVLLTALKQVYQKAQHKQIQVEFNPVESISLNIDRRWTMEAISNILDNAVKYTNRNGLISISVQKYELFSRIDIEDNGSGIEEEETVLIFNRFYRGKNAANSDGVGIGLYLAREIITMQNGYIKVKSQPGSGSFFSVFLPL